MLETFTRCLFVPIPAVVCLGQLRDFLRILWRAREGLALVAGSADRID